MPRVLVRAQLSNSVWRRLVLRIPHGRGETPVLGALTFSYPSAGATFAAFARTGISAGKLYEFPGSDE